MRSVYLSLKDSDSAYLSEPWNLCGLMLQCFPSDSDVWSVQEPWPQSP